MSEALEDRVRGMAADVFGMDPGGLTLATQSESIEAWDSVGHLNLMMALEEAFGVEFEPEEIEAMRSIGKIVDVVRSRQNGA